MVEFTRKAALNDALLLPVNPLRRFAYAEMDRLIPVGRRLEFWLAPAEQKSEVEETPRLNTPKSVAEADALGPGCHPGAYAEILRACPKYST